MDIAAKERGSGLLSLRLASRERPFRRVLLGFCASTAARTSGWLVRRAVAAQRRRCVARARRRVHRGAGTGPRVDEESRVRVEWLDILGSDGECFFFQAEDGIRDLTVTGVQTCALPI